MPRKFVIVHWRVRAKRDQKVERRHARAQFPLEDVKQQRHRHRARAVRDQNENSPPIDREGTEAAGGGRSNLCLGEIARISQSWHKQGGNCREREVVVRNVDAFESSNLFPDRV